MYYNTVITHHYCITITLLLYFHNTSTKKKPLQAPIYYVDSSFLVYVYMQMFLTIITG